MSHSRQEHVTSPSWLRKSRFAFTLVEVALSIGLMSTIMYLFAMTFDNISTALLDGYARGTISNRIAPTVAQIESDILDSNQSHIAITTANLPVGQSAIVMSSPRDTADVFHVNSSGAPVWKKVIVYCPYVNPNGISQLRRYQFEASAENFPFTFAVGNPITPDSINLLTATAQPYVIDRATGNTSLAKGLKYQVFAPGMSIFQVQAGPPVSITLRAAYLTRRNATIAGQESFNVLPRN